MKKRLLTFLCLMLLAPWTYAVCPICTIAVGAGIGFSHWLGVDDTITGLWIGGLTVSLIIWTIDWLNRKNIRFYGRKILVCLAYYAFVILPLYPMGYIGDPLNRLWGIDKLVLGISVGSFVFLLGSIAYVVTKKHHGNKAYFPFQKVLMPIAPLIIFSIVFYFLVS